MYNVTFQYLNSRFWRTSLDGQVLRELSGEYIIYKVINNYN